MNEAIVALHQIIPQFQKDNKVQKVQCVILTDGESGSIPYNHTVERHWEDEPYMGTRSPDYGNVFCVIVNLVRHTYSSMVIIISQTLY